MTHRRTILAGATGATIGAMLPRVAFAATSPVLFVAAHPDDETLGMGVAIAEHAGQDVHVLLLTRGEASSVRQRLNGEWGAAPFWGVLHDPVGEGYEPLDPDAFGKARVNEAMTALRCLSTSAIIVHEAVLPDGGLTKQSAQAAMLAVADLIAPGAPVRIKTHTHIVDNHPDHLAAGAAARQLKADNPARFSDLRQYILPTYWTDTRLSQVAETWDTPANSGIKARAINACRSYGAWAPPHAFAIGFHSSYNTFSQLIANPKCLYHP